MALTDEDLARELRAAFETEAQEHLQVIASGLLDLEESPPARHAPVLETVYREAHSLKGAARAVNLGDIETICQSLENVFSTWKRRELEASPALFDLLQEAIGTMEELLSAPFEGSRASDRSQLLAVRQRLDAAADAMHAGGQTPQAPLDTDIASTQTASLEVDHARSDGEAVSPAPPAAVELHRESTPVDPAPDPGRPAAMETVRVSTSKLDTLLVEAEEMLTWKQTLSQRVADLTGILSLVERWRKEWARSVGDASEAPAPPRRLALADAGADHPGSEELGALIGAQQGRLNELNARMTAIVGKLSLDLRDVGGKVDRLLEDARRLVMQPFASLVGPMPKLVRDLARDGEKQVRVEIAGSEIEIDRRILEEMKDPLLHLVRNAVGHGIEKPEERERAGKPAQAALRLAISQLSAHEVEIVVADDGAGIDLAQVRASAVRSGLLSGKAAEQLDDAQATDLIFQSGISTSAAVSEISGRGLGMAIVRERVEKLGGRIEVSTGRGAGCSFRMHLPVALTTLRGVIVRSAGDLLVIPATGIERVAQVRADGAWGANRPGSIAFQDETIPLVRLQELLELEPGGGHDHDPGYLYAVILRGQGMKIAVEVDAVLDEQEMLVRKLGWPLRRVRNVAAATILGSGRPAPILRISDLLRSAAKLQDSWMRRSNGQ